MAESSPLPVKSWIMVPAIITFAITILRLIGELMNWSPRFFSRAGGGAGALVGIVWLVPILGIYYALKLNTLGQRPRNLGRGFGLIALAIAIVPIAGFVATRAGLNQLQVIPVVCLALFAGIFVVKPAWPALARLLWIYGLAARIPVILVMGVAILADWGTHYDVAPPGFPPMPAISKWLVIGVFPQITLWMGFTVVVGMLFGLVTMAVSGRKG